MSGLLVPPQGHEVWGGELEGTGALCQRCFRSPSLLQVFLGLQHPLASEVC